MSPKPVRRRLFALIVIATAAGVPLWPQANSAEKLVMAEAGGSNSAYSGDGGPATEAGLEGPRMVAFDNRGGYYIADTMHNVIRHVDANGIITTAAGTGKPGYNGDGIPAQQAMLQDPHRVDVDAAGNLYIGDPMNNRVRMVDTAGIIHTIAGTGDSGFAGDGGQATAAKLHNPKIALLSPDDKAVFVADYENNRIRRVDLATGIITTIMGTGSDISGGDGGPATEASLAPRNMVFDMHGDLIVADRENNTIRKLDMDTGIVDHLAGRPSAEGGYDGDGGPAKDALLNLPRGLGADWLGNIYIADSVNNRVRMVSPDGMITTVVGTGEANGQDSGVPVDQARLTNPRHAIVADDGTLFISDTGGNRIVKVPEFLSPRPAPAPAPTTPVHPAEQPAPPAPAPSGSAARSGYWMLGADGAVYNFGDAAALGDAKALASPVDLEPTPSGDGFWVVSTDGAVLARGKAIELGEVKAGTMAAGEKATSLSATTTGKGYWIFTNRGRVHAFGDAKPYGDLAKVALNSPVLDSVPTATGQGYYMVAGDGGIFAFGDATFYGSMGDKKLNAPVQSLVPDPDGKGYWLVASDGGVFAFEAPFRGSAGNLRLNKPVTGMVPYGNGYLMVAEDGGAFNYSDKPFSGSLGDRTPARPIVSVAALA